MYTIPSQRNRTPSDEMIFSYNVSTTALNDGTLIVYVVHELVLDRDMNPVTAQVGVSLQFEYNPATQRVTKSAVCSFECNELPRNELDALRDYLVRDAIDKIEYIHATQGRYEYHDDTDVTLFHAPLQHALTLNDLSAELNCA